MITDWAGNEIKPGMEVAFLQTVIHHSAGGILWPAMYVKSGKPMYEETQKAHDEPCWILGEFRVVEGSGDDLYITIITPDWPHKGYTCSTINYIGKESPWTEKKPVLVIKGVSDKNPNQ